MSALEVLLPVPVGINSSGRGGERRHGAYLPVARHTRGGVTTVGLMLSPEARAWKEQAALLVRCEAVRLGWEPPMGELRLRVVRGDRADLDSGVKLMDAVALGLGIDDRRFEAVTLLRRPPDGELPPGMVLVRVAAGGVTVRVDRWQEG